MLQEHRDALPILPTTLRTRLKEEGLGTLDEGLVVIDEAKEFSLMKNLRIMRPHGGQ